MRSFYKLVLFFSLSFFLKAASLPKSAYFCLVNSDGNPSSGCTGPKLIAEELALFKDLYTEEVRPRTPYSPSSRILNPLIGQSTSAMANQMLSKAQLDSHKLQMIPNVLNWQKIQKLTIFGGSQSEGQVVVPNRNWIHTAHKNQGIILGTIFLPPDFYGGDKLNGQVAWMLNPKSSVAQNLVDLAKLYGFDGYFINGESNYSQSHKPDFGVFVEEIKALAIKANYPLHIEWYVVGSVAMEDMVISSSEKKVTSSVFIDHYIWSSFEESWQKESSKDQELYNPRDVEYGAYDLSELDQIVQSYKGNSLSYFTFNTLFNLFSFFFCSDYSSYRFN